MVAISENLCRVACNATIAPYIDAMSRQCGGRINAFLRRIKTMLNELIDATESKLGGPRVVSENHDFAGIKVDTTQAARNASGVGWDPSERGISEAEAMRLIQEAQNDPEKMRAAIETLQRAALKMANLTKSAKTGKIQLLVSGVPSWHELGIRLDGQFSGSRGLDEIGRRNVGKSQGGYLDPFGRFIPVEGSYYLVSDDNDRHVSSNAVGDRYSVFQDHECVDMLERVGSKFGAKFESMGILNGGEKFFASISLPDDFEVSQGDSLYDRVLVRNSHGLESLLLCDTTTRTVCQNTVVRATKNSRNKFAIRHSLNMRQKLERVESAMHSALLSSASYQQAARRMHITPIADPIPFFNEVLDQQDLLDCVVGVTSAEAKLGADGILATILDIDQQERERRAKQLDRAIRKRQNILDELIDRYNSERNAGGFGETVWSAYNSVTEWANHGQRYNSPQEGSTTDPDRYRAENRLDSILSGKADTISQSAYSVAQVFAGF